MHDRLASSITSSKYFIIRNVIMIQRQLVRLIATAAMLFLAFHVFAQDVIAPPAIGQDTKGEIAIPEEETSTPPQSFEEDNRDGIQQNEHTGFLGKTDINEQRRENGQVYRIELKHSGGTTQYIDEDNEGKLENSDDIDEAPNLAKWRLGSW